MLSAFGQVMVKGRRGSGGESEMMSKLAASDVREQMTVSSVTMVTLSVVIISCIRDD